MKQRKREKTEIPCHSLERENQFSVPNSVRLALLWFLGFLRFFIYSVADLVISLSTLPSPFVPLNNTIMILFGGQYAQLNILASPNPLADGWSRDLV